MALPTQNYFATLTQLTEQVLDEVSWHQLDFNSDRALWEIHGSFKQYRIRLKEIFSQSGRMYSYYVIRENKVMVGFDNYPDRRALQQKYGQYYKRHIGKLVPHQHGERKITVQLTEEMTVEMFLDYLNLKK